MDENSHKWPGIVAITYSCKLSQIQSKQVLVVAYIDVMLELIQELFYI